MSQTEEMIKRIKDVKDAMDKMYVPASEKNSALATSLYQIGRTNPFMGSVLQVLNIMYTYEIPTAGVSFNPEMKRWDLFINPFFFCRTINAVKSTEDIKQGDAARKAILLHELYHIINKHPMRVPFMRINPRRRQIMNIAADMAINQFIKNLPAGCKMCPPPDKHEPCKNPDCPGKAIDVHDWYDEDSKGKKTPWEENQTMEHYYEKILTKLQEDPNGGDGEGEGEEGACKGLPSTLDKHMWDASGEEKDMIEATEDLVKRAMIKARLSYDELDGKFKELLKDIESRKAQLNYKALILAAIKKSASGHERKHTWTRKSRRYGNKAPGTKEGDLPKLSFFIDTSGSISIEEGNEFLNVVDEFLKIGSRKCWLNLFNTTTYYKNEYRLGNRVKREEWMSGGTDLEDSMKNILDNKPDLAVIVTDGCYGNVEVEKWMKANDSFPQCLFIISKDGTKDHPLKRLGCTIQIPQMGKRRD